MRRPFVACLQNASQMIENSRLRRCRHRKMPGRGLTRFNRAFIRSAMINAYAMHKGFNRRRSNAVWVCDRV
jgi:hypothetical protein